MNGGGLIKKPSPPPLFFVSFILCVVTNWSVNHDTRRCFLFRLPFFLNTYLLALTNSQVGEDSVQLGK